MKIEKVINNNVVCSRNDRGREIVIMGRGIGFKAKEGNEIDQDKIEKVFHIENPATVNRFTELLTNMPLQHIQISNDIISYAKKSLNTKLNQNIYVTLTDHINFAIERYRQGIEISNALLWEIKRFYHQEFIIGEFAVSLINDRLNMDFTEDEAGFIALHIVNAEYDTSLKDAINITRMIQDVLGIIIEEFQMELDEESLHYERFLTHIKFLAQRLLRKELLTDDDEELQELMLRKYPREHKCGEKLAEYIGKEYGTNISKEEIMYLALHIKRLTIPAQTEE